MIEPPLPASRISFSPAEAQEHALDIDRLLTAEVGEALSVMLGAPRPMPALLTSTSSRPCAAFTSAMTPTHSSSEVSRDADNGPCRRRRRSDRPGPALGVLEVGEDDSGAGPRQNSAHAAPMPLAAPVTAPPCRPNLAMCVLPWRQLPRGAAAAQA